MKPHTGEGAPSMSTNSHSGVVTLRASKHSIRDFAGSLARLVGRPVIDKTRLEGDFDFNLEWSSERAAEAVPSVFTALRALGLRLVSTKGPAEFIVIDHIERPSQN